MSGLPSDPRFDPKRRSDGAGPVFVPNTNKHATEGSNPIWMTGAGYDNVTFGFDDDDIDSRYMIVWHKSTSVVTKSFVFPKKKCSFLLASSACVKGCAKWPLAYPV